MATKVSKTTDKSSAKSPAKAAATVASKTTSKPPAKTATVKVSSKKGRGKAAKEALLKQKREQEKLNALSAQKEKEAANEKVADEKTAESKKAQKPKKLPKITDAQQKQIYSKKLRSGNPAMRGEVIADYLNRKETAVAKPVQFSTDGRNPAWLVPMLIGAFVIGIVWVVTFYMTANIGGYPIPAIGYFNFVAGFGFILLGFGLSTRWK